MARIGGGVFIVGFLGARGGGGGPHPGAPQGRGGEERPWAGCRATTRPPTRPGRKSPASGSSPTRPSCAARSTCPASSSWSSKNSARARRRTTACSSSSWWPGSAAARFSSTSATTAAGCSTTASTSSATPSAPTARLKQGAPALVGLARDAGLDVPAFKMCLEKRETQADVQRDVAEGDALNVQGTPTFYVNGRPIEGLVPAEEFFAIVDGELAAARAAATRE